jgi:DDE superfamily endonuclease
MAVLLFEDETILRLFLILRRAWSLRGQQAVVNVSGRNDKRVLFGTINLRTGHRMLIRQKNMRQESFHTFLYLLWRCYRGRPIWLLLDRAPCHITSRSKALAEALKIETIWLPKQCSELNGMDHFGREVKDDISANYQYSSIDEHARYAEDHSLAMSNRKALHRAGILSNNFWLKAFLK